MSAVLLTDEEDSPLWSLPGSVIYSVKTFGVVPAKNSFKMWKVTIPHKIHVFEWLLFHNKLLTRQNLAIHQTVAFILRSEVDSRFRMQKLSIRIL